MGKKKKAKKKIKNKQQSDAQNRSLLGVNAGQATTALAGAIIGQIAEAAIARLLTKASENQKLDEARHSVQAAAVAVKDAVDETHPSVQSAIDAIRAALEDVQPAVVDTVDTLKPGQETQSVRNRITDTIAKAKNAAKTTRSSIKKNKKKSKKK